MRRLVLGSGVITALVLAVALGTAAGANGGSGAGSAAVAATGAPASPLPGTVPPGSAIITVRNVLNGVPFVGPFDGPPAFADVSGEQCSQGVFEPSDETVVERVPWPWSNWSPCNLTGVPVRLCMFSSPPRVCSEEFVFDGGDATVDMEWSAFVDEHLSEWPTLTARFSHDGVIQPVTLTGWILRVDDHHYCSRSEPHRSPALLSSVVRIGETVGFCGGVELESIFGTEEFGDLTVRFFWPGDQDLTIEVDTGFLLSPTPSPTPYPQSMITVRFVHGGEPVVVESLSFPRGISADGVACQIIVREFEGSEFVLGWPGVSDDSQPTNCLKGPPTLVEIQFGVTFGVAVPWEGHDVSVEVEVPEDEPGIRIKPTPVATSPPVPGQLPKAGGAPGSASQDSVAAWIAVIAVVLWMATAAAWRGGRRRV